MHISQYYPYNNPGTGRFYGMKGLGRMGEVTSVDYGVASPDTSGFLSTLGPVLTHAAQSYGNIVTAQQANQGLNTVSTTVIWVAAAVAAIAIFGKKKR